MVGKDDPYLQTVTILEKIKATLNELGASLDDVIRTRMFVTDISRWKDFARAHNEYFGKIKPATSMIEVSALIDSSMLIETKVTAIKE
ncbi:Rid family hydrolase [Ignavibacterium sp.]|uniref:Rid family hydrolase n=1 Tax=Ignavibacterium sp. TaxID=2651167 RepID=UPI00307F53FA